MKQELKMCAKRLENSAENIYKLECLRFKAYNMKEIFEGETLYAYTLSSGAMIPFGFFINDNLVAGCYVSTSYGTLFIEQLFVHPQLQNSGLKTGRLLLNFVLANKEEIVQYCNTEFTVSAWEASTDKARGLYEKIGYRQGEFLMRKSI